MKVSSSIPSDPPAEGAYARVSLPFGHLPRGCRGPSSSTTSSDRRELSVERQPPSVFAVRCTGLFPTRVSCTPGYVVVGDLVCSYVMKRTHGRILLQLRYLNMTGRYSTSEAQPTSSLWYCTRSFVAKKKLSVLGMDNQLRLQHQKRLTVLQTSSNFATSMNAANFSHSSARNMS